MNKEKILNMLKYVGVQRVREIPKITHLQQQFNLHWAAAKKWHEILEAIPYIEEEPEEEKGTSVFLPSNEDEIVDITQIEPVVQKNVDFQINQNPREIAEVEVQGEKFFEGQVIEGVGIITKIKNNMFGDNIFCIATEDSGDVVELSEAQLAKVVSC